MASPYKQRFSRLSTNHNGTAYEHVVIAERVLGKKLPRGAQVHHLDGNGRNNAHRNLVICQDMAYHKLLHYRQTVLALGGHPDADGYCCECKRLKPLADFNRATKNKAHGRQRMCRSCQKAYQQTYVRPSLALSFVPLLDANARTATRKPGRGDARRQRQARKKAEDTYLRGEKAKAKARDHHRCRWPGCDCRGRRVVLESAHLVDVSLGGSDDASNLITLCDERHRGTPSLHSKDLRVEPLYERLGANGPCAFYGRDLETGGWRHVATERYIGVSEERGA